MQRPISLSAPSRLHFGLMSIGQQSEIEFGGIGMMIDSPRTVVTVCPANKFKIHGTNPDACRRAIENWFARWKFAIDSGGLFSQPPNAVADLPLEIWIEARPPRHCGLGSGTQLAFCSIAAVHKFLNLPLPSAEELSAVADRGKRSAIGSHGFFCGGFLVDRGKSSEDAISPLDFRTDFPDQWPIVMVLQRDVAGLSGVDETQAFENLPGTDPTARTSMLDLVRDRIIPGILDRDYPKFGQAIYQYGRNSGLYFQQIQGGPYNGELVTDLVSSIRSFDVPAVGQTSWGPGVFAIAPDVRTANRLVEKLSTRYSNRFDIITARADNWGVREVATKNSPVERL